MAKMIQKADLSAKQLAVADAVSAKAAASGQEVHFYKVRVDRPFVAANTVFMPGRDYRVSARVYDSTLEGGGAFKERCLSSMPIMRK